MFKFAPNVWKQFPWGADGTSDEDLLKNDKFIVFAGQFMGMLDMAIDMLGPDLDLVESQLQKLGSRHIEYGVMPKHYPLMGQALSDTLQNRLGDEFKNRIASWNAIYTFMSISMLQGAFQQLTFERREFRKLKSRVREAKRRDSQTSASSSSSTGDSTDSAEKKKQNGAFSAWMKRLSLSSK